MADRTVAGSLQLKADWDLGEDNWKDDMDANLVKLSVLGMPIAIDLVSATPGAPDEGDVFLFDETHATHANAVAAYDEAGWVYYTPVEGWMCYDSAASVLRQFDGTVWAEFTSGGGGGGGVPPGGTFHQVLTKLSATDGDADWLDPNQAISGVVKIAEFIAVGGEASIDFADLPQDYDDLIIVWSLRTDQSSVALSALNIRFNGDGGGNYDFEKIHAYSSGSNFSQVAGANEMQIGDVAASTADAAKFGVGHLSIPEYSSGAKNKTVYSDWQNSYGTGGFSQGRGAYGGLWRDNDAITDISIVPGGGDFVAGSKVTIYGRGGQVVSNAKNMGMTGHYVLLHKIEITTGDTEAFVTGISQVHDDLVFVYRGGSNGADINFSFQFNGDTGANYDSQLDSHFEYDKAFNTTDALVGRQSGTTYNALSDFFTGEIIGYASTASAKNVISRSMGFGGGNYFNRYITSRWQNSDPITDIRLFVTSGSMGDGILEIYGRGGQPGIAVAKPWYWKPPKANQFTIWKDSGMADPTLTDDSDTGLIFEGTTPAAGDTTRGAYVEISNPSGDWRCTVHLANPIIDVANYSMYCMSAFQYATDEVRNLGFAQDARVWVYKASLEDFGSSHGGFNILCRNAEWFRMVKVGTTITYQFSHNGKRWFDIYADTGEIEPDWIGFGCFYNSTGAMMTIAYDVDHFELIEY